MYRNVMVVDDSYFDRLIAEKVIQLAGFSANSIAFDTCVKAMDYLMEPANSPNMPQVIFLDISMPEVDGFDFLKMFENAPEQVKSQCQIYMLSSSVNPYDINKAAKCKYVSDFISKPLTKEKLFSIIQ